MGDVPGWVPVLVALFGFVGVITSQVLTGRRDDRRWRRELEREEVGRKHEYDDRRHDARADAYAKVIGAVESFDILLFEARHAVAEGKELTEQLAAELRAETAEARHVLGPVTLHAPERIRSAIRETMLPRLSLSRHLINYTDQEKHLEYWTYGQREYRKLRAAMRRDLGLDSEELD